MLRCCYASMRVAVASCATMPHAARRAGGPMGALPVPCVGAENAAGWLGQPAGAAAARWLLLPCRPVAELSAWLKLAAAKCLQPASACSQPGLSQASAQGGPQG